MSNDVASKKRRRHTPDQIIRKLAEGNKLRPGTRRGVPAPGDRRVDVASLARPVRRHESQRRQAAQRPRGREHPVEEAGRQPGPRHRHAQGDLSGKLLTPNRKRRAVEALRDRFGVSERRACTVVGAVTVGAITVTAQATSSPD